MEHRSDCSRRKFQKEGNDLVAYCHCGKEQYEISVLFRSIHDYTVSVSLPKVFTGRQASGASLGGVKVLTLDCHHYAIDRVVDYCLHSFCALREI